MKTPHKTCTKCGEAKPLTEFYKEARNRDGHGSRCKTCAREQGRRHREKNREKANEYARRYGEKHRERLNEYARRYREENLGHINERDRRYRKEHREQITAQNRQRHGERQSLTASLATTPPRTPWLPGEDALLMADNGMTIYQKAIELGRTYSSCRGRRTLLLKKAHTT